MRHAIEAGRQASEAFVKALIDDQTEAMIRSDPDSCIMSCNESASRFSGISRLNLIGTRFTPGTPPEAQVRPMAELSFLSPTSLTLRIIDPKHLPNGETSWLEWSNRALFHASGRLTSHLSVARDITEACHAAAACEVLDAAYPSLNCWQEGWAGASAAREGCCATFQGGIRAHLDPGEWECWYEALAAERTLPDPCCQSCMSEGRRREGGSHRERMSRARVWSTFMDEHTRVVRRWREFLAA